MQNWSVSGNLLGFLFLTMQLLQWTPLAHCRPPTSAEIAAKNFSAMDGEIRIGAEFELMVGPLARMMKYFDFSDESLLNSSSGLAPEVRLRVSSMPTAILYRRV